MIKVRIITPRITAEERLRRMKRNFELQCTLYERLIRAKDFL